MDLSSQVISPILFVGAPDFPMNAVESSNLKLGCLISNWKVDWESEPFFQVQFFAQEFLCKHGQNQISKVNFIDFAVAVQFCFVVVSYEI